MPWPRPAMWVNTGPHEHHDTSQTKKHLQVSLGHLVRRGMRCLGRTAEASAGVSCGWPFLPCQKPRVLSLSKPEAEVTHGYTAKYRQTHVLLLCAPSQPAVPGLWPRSCAASGILADTPCSWQQECLSAPKHAASLHAEAELHQKEWSLQFCTSQQVEFKTKTRQELLRNCKKCLCT